MNRLWLVFEHEFYRSITRKGYLFATLGVPLIAVVIFFGNLAYQSLQTDDSDADSGNVLQNLDLEQLEQAGIVDYSNVFATPPERFTDVLVAYPDELTALAALESNEIDVFLVFGEDYLETGDATLHLRSLNLILATEGQRVAEQLAYSTFASGLDELRLSRLSNVADFTDFDLSISDQGTDEATEEGQFLVVYVFASVFFISLIVTNTYLMQTVIEERENRMMEILIATVPPTQMIAGKILALALLGFIQILAWIVTTLGLVFAARFIDTYAAFIETISVNLSPELFGMMAIFFVLMYLLYAGIFGMIGAISGSSQEGSQYVGFLVIPAMLPFYFFELIQNEPDGILALGFSIFPITAPITIMARSVVGSVPAWQVALSIGLLAITMVSALWMAGRVFRVQTLLSGNRIKVSDLPRLIFQES